MRDRDIEERFLPLVHHLAGSLAARLPRHVPIDELISAGLLALTEASRSFDATRGVPFERYAATRIRGALLDELRGMDWAARSVRIRARAVESCTQDLTAELRRPPTKDEVAATLGVNVAELRRWASDLDRAVVIHYQGVAEDDECHSLLPAVERGPEEAVLEGERRRELHNAIALLPDRHRAVIQGWFFEGRRMEEIAAELGVTASRVSQLRTEALQLLQDALAAPVGDALDGRGARRRAAFRRALQAA